MILMTEFDNDINFQILETLPKLLLNPVHGKDAVSLTTSA